MCCVCVVVSIVVVFVVVVVVIDNEDSKEQEINVCLNFFFCVCFEHFAAQYLFHFLYSLMLRGYIMEMQIQMIQHQ